jgi:hypothetical protein
MSLGLLQSTIVAAPDQAHLQIVIDNLLVESFMELLSAAMSRDTSGVLDREFNAESTRSLVP